MYTWILWDIESIFQKLNKSDVHKKMTPPKKKTTCYYHLHQYLKTYAAYASTEKAFQATLKAQEVAWACDSVWAGNI